MNAEPIFDRYYSIHISRWPVWLLWKQLWRRVPLFAPLIFPLLLLQRIPGLKPDPQFASVYPENINPVSQDDIPARARTSLQARIREAEEIGFHLCHWFALETLGHYEQYDASMLDETGTISLLFRWYELHIRNDSQKDLNIFCSSTLPGGGSLSSSAMAKKNVIPEMRLPDDQHRNYPETTGLEDLVRYHREAIPEHTRLHQYDCNSLLNRFRERSRQLVDYVLERRIFFELTPQEIHKLQQQDAKREQSEGV
jgi:hypothetical protein